MAYILHKPISIWEGHQVPIIRYRGTFSWEELYRITRRWIESQDFTYSEKLYKHKGDEVEVKMGGERKIDHMHKWYVEVEFHVWELRTVEVVEGSKTIKKNTGKVQIIIKGKIELDYGKKFSGGKINTTLGKWWSMISTGDIEANHIGTLTDRCFDLHEKLKKYLNITSDS